jgi:hypothetical protein
LGNHAFDNQIFCQKECTQQNYDDNDYFLHLPIPPK